MLAAIYTTLTPNTGFLLLLSIFAAVVLGGIGDAYGALLGGFTLGLIQEWSTNVVARRTRRPSASSCSSYPARPPQGFFGQAQTV